MKSKSNAGHVSVSNFDRPLLVARKLIRRILIALLVASACYVVPLLGDLVLLLDARMLVIIGACLIVLLTQPEITLTEAKRTARSDRYSVLLILACAAICQMMSILEWRYFRQDTSLGASMACIIVGGTLLIGGIALRVIDICISNAIYWGILEGGCPYETIRISSDIGTAAA